MHLFPTLRNTTYERIRINVYAKMKSLREDEKAKCVLLMHEFNSPTEVQRKFRSIYNTKEAPSRQSIRKWYKEFKEIGHMRGAKTGRKPLQELTVQNVKTFYEASPSSSIRQGARELNMPYSSVQKTIRRTLKFYPYKIKLVHEMKPEDGPASVQFAKIRLHNSAQDNGYLQRLCFSDEATFHISGVVSRQQTQCEDLG